MTRGMKSKYIYQPTVGVKTDFETLLQRFHSKGTVRYETFAQIWRDMKLSMYCAGRQTQRETREFVEGCLHIAVQFWLPPSSFLVRAGALYLLYGLYYFQLVSPRAKIRLTAEEWESVQEFQDEARSQQHLDLDFIFQKMKLDKAFRFVASTVDVYPGPKETSNLNVIPENLKEETNVIDEIFSSSSLNQLALVHDQYHKMKVALVGEDAVKPDTSLDIIHQDLISGVYKTLKLHKEKQLNAITGHKAAEHGDSDVEDPTYQPTASSSIQKRLKRKAFETSPGYFKENLKRGRSRKKSHTDEFDSDMDSEDVPVESSKIPRKVGSGRKPIAELFDKDDMDNSGMAGTMDLDAVFSMPDLDKIIPKVSVVPESENSSTEKNSKTETSNKGKAPLRGKVTKKGQKGRKQDTTCASTDISNGDESHFRSGKKRKKNSKNVNLKIKSALAERIETCSPIKRLKKNSEQVSESEACGSNKDKTSQRRVKRRSNGSTPKQKDSAKPLKTVEQKFKKSKTENDTTEATTDVKEPTAQEKLQIKLNKRKKDARISKNALKKKR